MKKLSKLLLLALVSTLTLTACGGSGEKDTKADQAADETAQGTSSVLKIGASPQPHAVILNSVKDKLAQEGVELEIVELDDYVIPNTSLEDGEIDANYFQHLPYLEEFNQSHSTHIVSVAGVHIEPMAIYSSKYTSLDQIPDGGTISIPNDATNGGRALLLLQSEGLIKLSEDAGITASDKDVVDNPKNLKFMMLEAAQLPRTLEDVDVSVINTNYALEGGLNPLEDSLAIESSTSPYVNIVAVKEGNENNENIQKLIEALQSDETKTFIEEEFGGTILPAFVK